MTGRPLDTSLSVDKSHSATVLSAMLVSNYGELIQIKVQAIEGSMTERNLI